MLCRGSFSYNFLFFKIHHEFLFLFFKIHHEFLFYYRLIHGPKNITLMFHKTTTLSKFALQIKTMLFTKRYFQICSVCLYFVSVIVNVILLYVTID
ncbi:hypothetical protein Hanom_Chr10g00940361 [Helianthus anomalus]